MARRICTVVLLLALSLLVIHASVSLRGKTGLDTQMDRLLSEVEDNLSYVNLHSDDEVASMASWFLRHGSDGQKARALYCLGRNQYNSRRYSAAIVTYTKALEYVSDTLMAARIHYDMAQTAAATMNTLDQIANLNNAAEAYLAAGYRSEAQRCCLEVGKAHMGAGENEVAERLFKSILGDCHERKDTMLEVRCLKAYALLSVQKDTADPELAIDLLSRAADQLRCNLSSEDKGILAYSYSLTGNNAEALKWLADAKSSVESPAEEASAAFREYQICARNGNPAKALAALEKVVAYGNKTQAAMLGETVAASQREYFRSEAAAQAEQLRSARMKVWLVALAALLAVAAVAVAAYLHHLEERCRLEEETAEKDRYLSLAEDLRKQIANGTFRDGGSPGKDGYKSGHKIPWNVDALERLCEQYYIYEGTENLKPKILKEAKAIVEGLRNDPKIQKSLEDMLNESYGGVMEKLREEFPQWKNEDYLLYCFCATGFSSTTISTLLEKDKKVVYNRVWRLKNRISNSDARDKEWFLRCLE